MNNILLTSVPFFNCIDLILDKIKQDDTFLRVQTKNAVNNVELRNEVTQIFYFFKVKPR